MKVILPFLYLESYKTFLGFDVAHKDAATPWQLSFQDPASPIMEGIIDLHHDIFFFYNVYTTICNVDAVSYGISFLLYKKRCS
jgi:hypothetical protein